MLDALSIDSADVYGTSMGGRTAQWLAITHPDRVRRLVLAAPRRVARTPSKATPRSAAPSRRPTGKQPERALLELMCSPEWLASHDGPRTVVGDRDMSAHARRHHLAASNGHNAWEQLDERFAQHGADDRMTPASNAELLAQRILEAEAHVLPGLRHAYFHENRPVASKLVGDFLAD